MKNWNDYEVAKRWGRWAIQHKKNKQVYCTFDTEEQANKALAHYKEIKNDI